MACTKKTECQEWMRKGDLACQKCPQAKVPQPSETPVSTGDDEEDNEDPEPGNGDEGEETFGIAELEPDEVDAIHDSMTDYERERCCESGNEAINSIDEALDFTERHLACLNEDCEDGGYRDGVKAALVDLRKARRLLARLLEECPF